MSVHVIDRKANPFVTRWRDRAGVHRSRSFASREEAEAFDVSVKNGATVVVAFTPNEARTVAAFIHVGAVVGPDDLLVLGAALGKLEGALDGS